MPTSVRPTLTVNLLAQDPASLIEGVYTGNIHSGGIVMPDGQLLIKRIGTRRISIASVYGLMVPYTLDVMVNSDTVQEVPNQRYDLDAVVQANKPIDFRITRTRGMPFSEQPDLFFFTWSPSVEFRPCLFTAQFLAYSHLCAS